MSASFEQLNVLVVHNSQYMRAVIADMVHALGFKEVIEASRTSVVLDVLALKQINLIIAHHEADTPLGSVDI